MIGLGDLIKEKVAAVVMWIFQQLCDFAMWIIGGVLDGLGILSISLMWMVLWMCLKRLIISSLCVNRWGSVSLCSGFGLL